MATRTRPALLEREAELAELDAVIAAASGGSGELVVIEGDAGIGKSRLLQAAAEAAEGAGMQVLSARGTELERDFPFSLVSQLFGPAVRATSEPERAKVLDDAARPAGPIIGVEAADTGQSYPPGASFSVLNALFWLTSNLAEGRPLFLAVDDVQWSDQASLRFLLFLLPRLAELPVTLALTLRTGEPGSDPELLAQLISDPAAQLLRPEPLGGASVAELVRTQLTSGASNSFCAACDGVSGGNPFMLNELLRELRTDRFQGNDDDAARVREMAPESIRRSVLARLARLSREAQQLARGVAVLGDDAEIREATTLVGLDAHAAREAADALAAAGILETTRPLRFGHPLLRNAIYADISEGEREDMHREAAQQLLNAGAEPERVAVHLLATDPGSDQRVVEALAEAAQSAIAKGAPEAATAYVRRALAEPAEPSIRAQLLRVLLTASFRSLDQTTLNEFDSGLLDEVTADGEGLDVVASDLAPLLLLAGRTTEGMSLLDAARAAAVKARDYELVVRFDAQENMWADLEEKTEPDWDRYADKVADDTPGGRLRLAMKAYAGARSNQSAETVAGQALRAVEDGAIFDEQRDAGLTGLPIWVLLRTDRLEAAERAIERYSQVARLRGPAPVIASIWMRGTLPYLRGQIASAEPDVTDTVEQARAGGYVGVVSDWVAQLVEILIERGAIDAAEKELEASGLVGEIPDRIRYSAALHARGCLRLAQGRMTEGLADLTELSQRLDRFGWSNPIYPTDALAAMALAGAGEIDAARERAERYGRASERWGLARTKGIALRCQGLVEGGKRGDELLREAVATLRRTPARLELARALTDLGASLRRANQRTEAREPLREALEIARQDGALATAQRAHEELEATGEKLRPLLASGVESLTPSERRVASMAAEGKTNRAIAQELFLTVKTIEAHLSSSYRKLEIASRSELPGALADEHGKISP